MVFTYDVQWHFFLVLDWKSWKYQNSRLRNKNEQKKVQYGRNKDIDKEWNVSLLFDRFDFFHFNLAFWLMSKRKHFWHIFNICSSGTSTFLMFRIVTSVTTQNSLEISMQIKIFFGLKHKTFQWMKWISISCNKPRK